MALPFGSLLLAAGTALAAAPAAAMTCLGIASAGLGLWLHAVLPPPDEAATEATILTAYAAM